MNLHHHSRHTTRLLLMSLACTASALCALPRDVEDLIQADKYAEALARVDELLKEKPGDKELQQVRADLTRPSAGQPEPLAERAPQSPGLTAGQNASPANSNQSSQISALEQRELDLIIADLGNSKGDARQLLLKELLEKTSELLRSSPDSLRLWATRATATLELEQAGATKEAGANLLRLGADISNNDQMISLLAMIKRKGWLMTLDEYKIDKVVVEKQAREQKENEEAAAAAQKKARAAKIADLRQQYRTCLAEEARWDEVTSKDRHSRNPTYENYSVDKSYEWGIKAAQILGELGKLGVKYEDLAK